ncbi:hypothetical protein [Nocardia lasii]|uniref:Uncharacterized protein n=1 Tax=Nocardia lasii TaxID=1616107 RepID=A0ABW1JQ47_9NOCA
MLRSGWLQAVAGVMTGLTVGYEVTRVAGLVADHGQLFGTSAVTAAVTCSLVATGAIGLFGWRRPRWPVAYSVAAAGLLIVGAVNALPAPTEWGQSPTAIGIGLGLLAAPSLLSARQQPWLVGGMIAAGALGYQWDNVIGGDHYRYRDYPGSLAPPELSWHLFAFVAFAAVLFIQAWSMRADRVEVATPPTAIWLGASIAASVGIIARFMTDSRILAVAAALLVVAVATAGVRWLPRESASTLAALCAISFLLVIQPGLDREPSTVTLLLGASAVLVGLLTGPRLLSPASAVGIGAGAGLLGALSFLSDSGWIRIGAGIILVFAMSAIAGSALPTTPALVAGWLALPALGTWIATERPGRDPGWTEFTPDTDRYMMWTNGPYHAYAIITGDSLPETFPVHPDLVVPGLLAAVLCLVFAVGLSRTADRSTTPSASTVE